ncbi:hypothetical protein HYU12_03785 [Candidatus Woesearchaeota archaeon]|nr:hypothetical protein [Candidatus Woesearchaeota archaeon]
MMLKTKRSELLRLFVVFALLAVSVGIVLISAAKVDTSAQLTSPSIVRGIAQPALHNLTIANSTINFTLTVSAGSNAMVRADFNRPAAFSVINCPVLLPAGWTCTKDNGDLVRYQNADGLAAGSSATFGINGTVTAISQNVSWTIDTYENTGGTIGSNSTKANVTVDADAPLVTLLNVTDGRHMFINTTNLTDGSAWVAYRDLTFNVSVSDIFYNVVNVSVYFNLSNVTPSGTFQPPNPGIGYNRSVVRLTSANPLGGYYNGTLVSTLSSTGSMPIVLNSTYRIYFAVVANDSAGNINITNGTAASFFNISVDGAAPVAYFPSRVRGSGIDDLFDAAIDNITTSSTTHNFSILVYDYEGSGVKNVWINASSNLLPSGVLTAMGSNNCGGVAAITVTGETCWNISSTLQGLGLSTGDQNATISYVLNDTVGNLNYTHETPFKMYLLVDDAAFTVVVTSNATSNFTKNNATVVNITAIINANLNFTDSTTHLPNVTINGPHLVRYNMTFKSAASRWNAVGLATQYLYQSTWFSSVHPSANSTVLIGSNGSTNSTLGEFGCINGDGVACTLQITWNDIFGRLNSSNITITIDNIAPILVNFTLENATNDVMGSKVNASGDRRVVVRSTDLLNFTVNAQNNIANVTLHNASSASTNSTLMTAGGERNFSLQLCDSDWQQHRRRA